MENNNIDNPPSTRVNLHIKWFSALKGYGFGTTPGIDGDVFFHFSLIQTLGPLEIGDCIFCEIVYTNKGYQVKEILSLQRSENTIQATQPEKIIKTTIKWFNSAKGYGFAFSSEDQADVFIHDSLLRKKHITNLIPGNVLKLAIIHGKNGLEAIDIID